ncbi:MAG TPA: site-specific integrase [Methylibium sp.]|uniref:tyrosine-type recombinase/integrase n=1 Tax=Methylibium sp. TaxID=2067992 RepID=UPI002DB7ACFB|nr:site-specific integrase [Methylibium sp.]HEU4458450.1 site-specific integrase [Methylibium sp.]
MTIRQLVDLYMAHYAGRDCTRLQRLTWWVAQLGNERLDEVCDDQVHAALEALAMNASRYFAGLDADGKPIHKAKKKPIAPATINRYAASLSAVFTWAIKRRIAPKAFDNPCRRIERRPENNELTRFLSDDERTRLLAACRASAWPRLYLLVLLALTTGARKGELLGLRWRDVDLVQRVVHVGRSKNGDPKVLPIVAAAAEQLVELQGRGDELVFPSRRRPDCAYAFEPRWKAALAVAKVKDFRFHDLRHSCASYLAQNGATLLEIGDLLGHRQVSMTKRYSHLASTHRAALVNRVLGDLR